MTMGRAQTMNRLVTFGIAILSGICGLQAQSFETVRDHNLWNRGQNVAGIALDSASVSYARIYGGYESGPLHNYGQASGLWNAGVVTESIRHIGKLSFCGKFSFEQSQGKDMYGSMFTEPGTYPIDVLEFTPGRKDLQKYCAHGGLSYRASRSVRLGLLANFDAANYSKRKDLRHMNYCQHFFISPGLIWHKDDMAAGISVKVGKRSETVKAEVVGSAESTYFAFFDKGLMYGQYESWEGSGIHLKEAGVNGLPVKDIYTGASVQFSYKGLFIEGGYTYSSGKAGEKDFIWFEFPANHANAHIAYRLDTPDGNHFFRFGFDWENLGNRENILEKTAIEGVITVEKLASNNIFRKETCTFMPEYSFVCDKWEIAWKAEGELSGIVSSQLYPFVCAWNLFDLSTDISSTVRLGKFDVSASIGFCQGFLEESSTTVSDIAGGTAVPYRIEEYHDYCTAYLKAPKYNVSARAKWDFFKGLYAMIEGKYTGTAASGVPFGKYRWGASVSIGYDF